MAPRLLGLVESGEATPEEQVYARWALGRWHAFKGDWAQVVAYLMPECQPVAMSGQPGMLLLALEALCRLAKGEPEVHSHRGLVGHGVEEGIQRVLAELKQRFPQLADTELAEANTLSVQPRSDRQRLALCNRMFSRFGLMPVKLQDPACPLGLDNLAVASFTPHASPLATQSPPLVSVIVPLYNAEATIATALHSLFAQTWRPLEIIVVDDASEDNGAFVVERFAGECPEGLSLRLLRHGENRGAYAARNVGLAEAQGGLITTHDSDDWSHPEKLARQVEALLAAPQALGCLSHWVRTTPSLFFHLWRTELEGWTYRNISSLMFRRRVFDALGFWDDVTVNADTEFHQRVLAAFGDSAVVDVLPGVPLAFGRADEGSLSQHSTTHLITQFVGGRHDYMASARRWHASATHPSDLHLPRRPGYRPFAAPAAMCRQALPVRFTHPMDELQACGLFDPGWYCRTHIDLQHHRIEPLVHYWEVGASEGRDPGPSFSTSGYLARYPDVADWLAESRLTPLHHFVRHGRELGHEPLPVFEGRQPHREGRPTLLLVGHAAGKALYGAERSLLDLARGLEHLELNLVVALPSAVNGDYLRSLQAVSLAVAVLPYGWWQNGKVPEPATVGHFHDLMHRFRVDLVHANTMVLDEPLVAAHGLGVPALVHGRELPEHDPALCETLNATPERLRRRVRESATGVIANSRHVAKWLGDGVPTAVVPNTIDMSALLALSEPTLDGSPPAVGMLSSNLPKKGLDDLEAMAGHLEPLVPDARIMIFGPHTPAVEALLQRQAVGEAPRNIEYCGYVDDPAQALAELDVVVNLSRFQESFGRTVLEAMTAARPVVAYAWGALPELVEHEVTGWLVPFGDHAAAARAVSGLLLDHALVRKMGAAGRQRAMESYGARAFAEALCAAYAPWWPNR
ncbi:glycosyltransferase [Halomonas sp. EGI 63088]|uniref:Glycosyltransferase n=1 Tax=Halomonas flagellata TaxID=2920385 RepID=A0ABS9RXW5_9GAMM|nr:glycosyltransferase [Halomonas flagellata]MCH4564683.1 glycosyltransferase [Halomonas flagellata]